MENTGNITHDTNPLIAKAIVVFSNAFVTAAARVLLVVALLLSTSILLVGCDDENVAPGTRITGNVIAGNNQDADTGMPAAINRGVVLDSTSSTQPQFASDVRDCLVNELMNFGQVDDELTDGANAIPALSLYLFIVGSNPTASYTSQYLHIELPGVAGLAAKPVYGDVDVLNALHQWDEASKAYSVRISEWQSKRDAAVAELQAFNIATDQWSGIASTVSALAAVMPAGTDVLLASDLENNQDAQITGSLAGSRVYVIQPTPSGDMPYADTLYANCVEFLTQMGASQTDITRYRAEQTPEALRAFMAG